MNINKEVLKSTQPCQSRWKNYLEHYSEFNGSFDEFIDLDKISYDDKIWVARKVLNRNQLTHFAVLCAESVLNIYEAKYPADKRISDCLTYMKTIVDFSSITQDQRERLMSLREGCLTARRESWAYAAADAAYVVAAVAAYAAYDAAAAVADVVAYAAAYDAAAGGYAEREIARESQRNLNLQFLKMVATL